MLGPRDALAVLPFEHRAVAAVGDDHAHGGSDLGADAVAIAMRRPDRRLVIDEAEDIFVSVILEKLADRELASRHAAKINHPANKKSPALVGGAKSRKEHPRGREAPKGALSAVSRED